MMFELAVKTIDETSFEITTIGRKIVYSPNGDNATSWVRQGADVSNMRDVPNLKSACRLSDKHKTKMPANCIVYFICDTNIVEKNTSFVTFQSLPSSNNNGKLPVSEGNFRRAVALFTARKSIAPTWINCKDEYLVPDVNHPEYEQWNNDAIVYALFNNSSQQSSLRQIDYKDKKWDIRNQFFFMGNAQMRELGDREFHALCIDAGQFPDDAYVWKLFNQQNTPLSADALALLDAAVVMVTKSMALRKRYHEANPQYHLNAWDAGWAQLKPMFKEYFPDDLKTFVQRYKAFEDRMREGVYEFGFLKR